MGIDKMGQDQENLSLKEKLYIVVFQANTRGGRAFDVALLWLILISITCIILETLPNLSKKLLRIPLLD